MCEVLLPNTRYLQWVSDGKVKLYVIQLWDPLPRLQQRHERHKAKWDAVKCR